MQQKDIIKFFDSIATRWDDQREEPDAVIEKIMDNAKICAGQDILDVACGTGVLFPFYLNREVGSVTGVDISPKMIEIASQKIAACCNINVICADIMEFDPDTLYDSIMIYNALPHFIDPVALIKKLSFLLKSGGRLTVAHGMSREKIIEHHGAAAKVSNELLLAEDLKKLFDPYFSVDVVISDDEYYQVSGIKFK